MVSNQKNATLTLEVASDPGWANQSTSSSWQQSFVPSDPMAPAGPIKAKNTDLGEFKLLF